MKQGITPRVIVITFAAAAVMAPLVGCGAKEESSVAAPTNTADYKAKMQAHGQGAVQGGYGRPAAGTSGPGGAGSAPSGSATSSPPGPGGAGSGK